MGFFKIKSHALKDVAAKIFLPVALSAALLVGTIGGMNSVFAAENEYDMANNDGKYYSDYSSLEETWDASLEVNRQIAEESVVLLKNQNDTLPLSGVKYISVFGKDSADFYYAGGGSGTAEGYYDDDQYYTLDRSLADAGYSVNPVLRRFYENDSLSGSYSAGGNYVNETDPSKFTAGVLDSYDRYSDAALIVLGRTGSEGGDLYMGGYDGEGNELKHALELTDAEANLVKHVTANFDTVIVVLNVPMQMELGWIDAEEGDPEYLGDIDAAFWIGHTGLNGAIAVGETLNGTINPSGKLADIYARDFKKDPTYFNAQDNLHIQDGTTDYQYKEGETTWLVHSVEYEEGMNHTGLRSNTNNFELLTGVLREEWGFKGYTVTDVVPASPANPYADTETLCRTGIDTILGAGNEDAGPTQGEWDADASNMWGGKGSVIVASGDQNDITYASVRNSAKRILYTSVNTAANKNGLDTSGFGAENTLSINIGVSSALKVNAGSTLGTGDVQYEMTSGTLPQGLSFTSDGSLEGTPIQAGTFTFTVKMIADGWIEAEQTFTLTVNNDLFEISETAGTVGKAFSGTILSSYLTENEATVEYSVYAGELPEGMTLAADGTLGGTPVQAGEYQVTIAADAVEEEESSGSVTTTQSQYLFNVTFTVTDSAKYTVTVQYGMGCAAQVESVYAGQSLTLADPVRYGYTFTGWYTDEACTKQASLTSISSDMTIYAGWAEIAEAVEESGCGSVIGTGSVLLGAGVLLAAAAVALVVCRSKKKA